MERKYVAVRTVGNPENVLDRIRQAVQEERRTKMIPAVKFERKARGEFYFFLAVEGQGIDILNTIQMIFSRWNLPGNIIPELLTPDQIQSMVSRTELETISSFELPYKPERQNNGGDPFDLSDAFSSAETVSDPSLGDQYNQLLHWLSATTEGTWQTFRNVCSVLKLVDNWNSERSIFRRLKLLGHIESSEDGRKWSICPTALVQCAADPDVCFLTGQQTPKLIEHLKEHYDVGKLPQWNFQGPPCMQVNGILTDDVELNGFNIVHVGTVSVQLAELIPDLEGWKDILPAIDRLSTATYNIEIWDGRKYIQCDNFYERNGRYVGDSGLYRLAKKEENNPYQMVLYFDEPNQQWLRGDWYGLRFLASHNGGRQFKVKYSSSTNELLIPVEEHWPLLYERSLVLASGMLPERDKKNKWLKYTNISNELAQVLADKLYVTIEEI